MILKVGSNGPLVKRIQFFLIGLGLLDGKGRENAVADGIYGRNTKNAVVKFQSKYGLGADGIVGSNTLAKMIELGLSIENKPVSISNKYPVKPSGVLPLSNGQKDSIFGKIQWKRNYKSKDREAIIITNGWEKNNIILVQIPQLVKLGFSKTGNVSFHKKAAHQLVGLWKEWDDTGLLKYVISYEGSYNPRLIRGSKTSLSQHAYGVAFDINAPWNGLGRYPAEPGQKGCLYELVPSMYKWGFYWGGHFVRRDGMHAEVYKVI
jgi:hypothetical protein